MSVTNLARRRGKILDDMLSYHREQLPKVMRGHPLADLRAFTAVAPPTTPLLPVLQTPGVAVIATCQKASPVQGLLVPEYQAALRAQHFHQSGAAGVAVYTDGRHYQGQLSDLRDVREGLPGNLPVIRLDFIFDPYHIYESRVAGADALILIAAILGDADLVELLELSRQLQMTAIVEVHSETELQRVLPLKPDVISVNRRAWQTFAIHADLVAQLRPSIPESILVIAKGGIKSAAEVQELKQLGISGVIIGEALARSQQPEQMLSMFVRKGRSQTDPD